MIYEFWVFRFLNIMLIKFMLKYSERFKRLIHRIYLLRKNVFYNKLKHILV